MSDLLWIWMELHWIDRQTLTSRKLCLPHKNERIATIALFASQDQFGVHLTKIWKFGSSAWLYKCKYCQNKWKNGLRKICASFVCILVWLYLLLHRTMHYVAGYGAANEPSLACHNICLCVVESWTLVRKSAHKKEPEANWSSIPSNRRLVLNCRFAL